MRVCGRTAGGKEKRLLSITNHNISFAVRAEFIYDCVCGGGRWAAAGRVRTIGAGSAGRVDDRWTDELEKSIMRSHACVGYWLSVDRSLLAY